LSSRNYEIEDLFVIIFTGLAILVLFAVSLASFSIFSPWLIWLLGSFLLLWILYLAFKSKLKIQKTDLLAVFIAVVICIFIGLFAHDNFFGRSDEGIYSNCAVYLSNHGTLKIPGDISMDGFIRAGNHSIPQFHFGYISYLAVLYSVFGVVGIKVSGSIALFFGLCSLYFIGKRVANQNVGIWTILLLGSFYPVIWFSRTTLSEPFSLALFWFTIFCLTKLYHTDEKIFLVPAIISAWLLALIRPEGIIILALFYGIVFVRRLITKKPVFNYLSILISFVFLSFYVYYSYFVQKNYLGMLEEAIFGSTINLGESNFGVLPADAISLRLTNFVLWVFAQYHFIVYMILGTLGVVASIKRKERRWQFIVIIVLALTSFVLVINPGILLAQPWMLRRYIIALFPFFILGTVIFLDSFFHEGKRIKKAVVLASFLVLNLIVSRPILAVAEFDGMRGEITKVAKLLPRDRRIYVRNYSLKEYDPSLTLLLVDGLDVKLSDNTTAMFADFSQSAQKTAYYLIEERYVSELDLFARNYKIERTESLDIEYNSIERSGLIYKAMLPRGSWWNQASYYYAKKMTFVPSRLSHQQFNLFIYKISKI